MTAPPKSSIAIWVATTAPGPCDVGVEARHVGQHADRDDVVGELRRRGRGPSNSASGRSRRSASWWSPPPVVPVPGLVRGARARPRRGSLAPPARAAPRRRPDRLAQARARVHPQIHPAADGVPLGHDRDRLANHMQVAHSTRPSGCRAGTTCCRRAGTSGPSPRARCRRRRFAANRQRARCSRVVCRPAATAVQSSAIIALR